MLNIGQAYKSFLVFYDLRVEVFPQIAHSLFLIPPPLHTALVRIFKIEEKIENAFILTLDDARHLKRTRIEPS